MSNEPSLAQRLADTLLEGGLDDFVQSRRSTGRSWRLIARDLYEITQLDVTYETLRSWYPDDRRRAQAAS